MGLHRGYNPTSRGSTVTPFITSKRPTLSLHQFGPIITVLEVSMSKELVDGFARNRAEDKHGHSFQHKFLPVFLTPNLAFLEWLFSKSQWKIWLLFLKHRIKAPLPTKRAFSVGWSSLPSPLLVARSKPQKMRPERWNMSKHIDLSFHDA